LCGAVVCAGPTTTDRWKFDAVYLKSGVLVEGLLIRESPSNIAFLPIRQNPGEPTSVAAEPVTYLQTAVLRVEKLDAADRETLVRRLEALRTGGDERRMKALKLRSIDWGKAEKKGVEFRGERFVLLSDAEERTVRRVAAHLEDLFLAFAQFLPPRIANAKPTTFHLFRSVAEFHASLKRQGADLINPAFYDSAKNEVWCGSDLERLEREREAKHRECQETLDRLKRQEAEWHRIYHDHVPQELLNALAADRQKIARIEQKNDSKPRQAAQRFYQILYHEAFHAYVANCVYPPDQGELPRWLNEGLAQIFENAIIEAGELRIRHADPLRLRDVKTALQLGEIVPVADLLRVGWEGFQVIHAQERRVSNEFYLSSWALAFYLTFELHKIGTPEFDRYIRSLKARDTDPVAAFVKLVGEPLGQFDNDFHQYLRHLGTDGRRN
jgi:hypothetical protein